MQEAIPYRTHPPTTLKDQNNVRTIRERESIGIVINKGQKGDLKKLVQENAVIVFARRGCCMSHVVKRLLQGLGANPAVYEVEEGCEDNIVHELRAADTCGGGKEGVMQFPVVFIGGRWFGGLDQVMATHITGELTPLLKQAGALWL
ncbi:hypothetical protein Pfo_022449 [Paulownia fortunei]|nr:hypothetical protein Pfo_022449 [Paulownia fortunei]